MRLDVEGFNRVYVPNDERIDACSEGLLNVKEAMRFLGVSQAMLYQLMERGYLPYVKIGRARRVPRKVLVQFAAERLIPGRSIKDVSI